jgi:UMF1 family MFS transporter
VALLARFGLTRPELRAWAWYDFANSAFFTTVIVAVFPDFFSNVAGAGLPPAVATTRFAWATTIAVALTAVLGPILGAMADFRGAKKGFLALFVGIGVVATLLMAGIDEGEWRYAALLFIIANVAVAGSLTFYDSLLPHIASPDEIDRVSTAGYAMGYVGGGVLLLVNLAWILSPATFGLSGTVAAVQLSFASVAVWWLVFSIPLFRGVAEPPRVLAAGETGREPLLRAAFVRVAAIYRELRGYPQAFLMLVAFLLYSDGIQTIIRMSAIYGAEIGIDTNARIAAFIMVQFVGIPFAFLFGALAGRIGAKTSLYLGLGVYVGTCLLAYFMNSALHFFVLAFLVGTVQGGCQALSRSVFARMIPQHKSSQYFGFFSVSEKFAGIAGPALFAGSITLFGSSRMAILSVILFFVAGGLVLSRVDIAAGEAQAGTVTSEVS